MCTKDKPYKYYLSTLDKFTHQTTGNVLRLQNQITEILTDYLCDATESGAYGHAFHIYSDKVWLTKDGITTAVAINKI